MYFLRGIWVIVLLITSLELAFARNLTGLSVTKTDAVTEVKLEFDEAAREADSMFAIAEGKPRLVLDYRDTGFKLSFKNSRVQGKGLIETARYARRGKSEQDLRLVLDLTTAKVLSSSAVNGNTLTLTLQSTAMPAAATLPVRAVAAHDIQTSRSFNGKVPYPRLKPLLRATNSVAPKVSLPPVQTAAVEDIDRPRYFTDTAPYPRIKPFSRLTAPAKLVKKPVIVIDPGHGGYDPGAIGVAGTKEKKITYAASLELQKQLMATGRYSVIITRSKDIYVAHEDRLRTARAGGADLFISIHADATASGSARGASVYTLADRAVNRSKRIVNSQNWIMDVDLSEQSDPVGDILVDLAQRKTATQSDAFAETLIAELRKSTKLIGNTHRRAGYFVLLAPDVPAVLLELGFLSNASDEKLLNDKSHRKKVIRSVTRAINLHFDKQKS